MSILSGVKATLRTAIARPGPRVLTVKRAWRLTPNMVRVTFAGPELQDFPTGREGGNCKLLLPKQGEAREAFENRLKNGPAPVRRTYTVRAYRQEAQELDIDFVAHGDNGPASRWASHAEPGDFLGFMGPSTPKVTDFYADWYLIAADPSAIPVAAATLEAMPRDAQGIALFEITHHEDKQAIDAPTGVDIHWLVNPDPTTSSPQQEAFLRALKWPAGRVQTCIAGESGVIRALRVMLHQERQVPREDTYISGYWKIGLVEDEHQALKKVSG
ncbi:MAG: siderophore-interacting protein [Pseudomonadota bacterium]